MAVSRTSVESKRSKSNGKIGHEQEISGDLARLRDDVSELAQSISDLAAGKAGDMRDHAGVLGEDITLAAQHRLRAITKELNGLERKVAENIQRNPLQSLGLAIGAGFVLALLTRK